MTQDGIALGVGITRSHVPRELDKLRRNDLIEERLARIRDADGKSYSTRKMTYSLTPKGIAIADMIMITRNSPTAGECFYYRVVVEH